MLTVCHDQHLVHTDLKPENILFRDSMFDICNDPMPRAARTVSLHFVLNIDTLLFLIHSCIDVVIILLHYLQFTFSDELF